MEKVIVTAARRQYPDVSGERIDRRFDAFDKKGRQFGAMVRKFTCRYELETSEMWDYGTHVADAMAQPTGTFYGFHPHAMRGGSLYGASQGERTFATEAERDAAIERYFAAAERGALKNKARVR